MATDHRGRTPFSGGSGVAGVFQFCGVFLPLSCLGLPTPLVCERAASTYSRARAEKHGLFLVCLSVGYFCFPLCILMDLLHQCVCLRVCWIYMLLYVYACRWYMCDAQTCIGMHPCTLVCDHVLKHAHIHVVCWHGVQCLCDSVCVYVHEHVCTHTLTCAQTWFLAHMGSHVLLLSMYICVGSHVCRHMLGV